MQQTKYKISFIFVISLFVSLPLYTASSSSSSISLNQSQPDQPFFKFEWKDKTALNTIHFFSSEELKDWELGEFIHRAQIDSSCRRDCYSDMCNSFFACIEYFELHAHSEESAGEALLSRNLNVDLKELSGMQWKIKEETKGVITTTTSWVEQIRDRPAEIERDILRRKIFADQVLPERQKKIVFSLALARALLHNKYVHSVYYLLRECDQSINLSNYIRVRTSPKEGPIYKTGTWKSVPSLLHACILNPCFINVVKVAGEKKISFDDRGYIKALLKAGADASTKDSEGMTPLDVLNKRILYVRRIPKYWGLGLSSESKRIIKGLRSSTL